jgi:hypothetical protein
MFGVVFGQGELTTRVYEVEIPSNSYGQEFDLEGITGYSLAYAEINVLKVIGENIEGIETAISLRCDHTPNYENNVLYRWNNSNIDVYATRIYYSDANCEFYASFDGAFGTALVSVTAEFPQEDEPDFAMGGNLQRVIDVTIESGSSSWGNSAVTETNAVPNAPSKLA